MNSDTLFMHCLAISRRSSSKAAVLRMLVIVALAMVMSALYGVELLYAQAPRNFRPPLVNPYAAEAAAEPQQEPEPPAPFFPPLIIDTDPGVDDAVALAWLLSHPDAANILGIVSVAGNTTVENATKNIETILLLVGNPALDIPVIEGAKKPLNQKHSSIGKALHGKDGLWGAQIDTANAAGRPKDARQFYCSQEPGATILALGPLTNIATAIRHCRHDMLEYERIIILGGAKSVGNTTPEAEFNFWQDPEAAQIVLDSGMNIELVPLETFTQVAFGDELFAALGADTPPVLLHLVPTLGVYGSLQGYPAFPFGIPDLVAAMYAVNRGLAQPPVPALVEVLERPDLVRGQTVIGFDVEWATMVLNDKQLSAIIDEAFSLSDDPAVVIPYLFGKIGEKLATVVPDAFVVRTVDAARIHSEFLNFVSSGIVVGTGAITDGEQLTPSDTIYLPSITVD
jgi:inosine-uridine nucleoside N-ribohydrolase